MTRSLKSEGETKGDKKQETKPGRAAGSSRNVRVNSSGPLGPDQPSAPSGPAALPDRSGEDGPSGPRDSSNSGSPPDPAEQGTFVPSWRTLKARTARRPARTKRMAGPDGRIPPLTPAIPPPPPQVDLQSFQRWSENGAGICLWSYVTRHSLDQVLKTASYFDRLKHHGLQRHDRIVMTAAARGKAPVHADFVVVQHEVNPQTGRHITLARLR